jgi:hypothetical protein
MKAMKQILVAASLVVISATAPVVEAQQGAENAATEANTVKADLPKIDESLHGTEYVNRTGKFSLTLPPEWIINADLRHMPVTLAGLSSSDKTRFAIVEQREYPGSLASYKELSMAAVRVTLSNFEERSSPALPSTERQRSSPTIVGTFQYRPTHPSNLSPHSSASRTTISQKSLLGARSRYFTICSQNSKNSSLPITVHPGSPLPVTDRETGTESSGGGKSRKRFLREEQQDAQPGSELFGRCLSRSEHLRLRDDAGV